MRVKAVNSYFWRRYGMGVGIYFAIYLAMVIIVALVMMRVTAIETVRLNTGNVEMMTTHDGMRAYDDASSITSDIPYVMLIPVLGFLVIRRDRRFLVAMSTARYEVLTGSLAFLLSMSLSLAVVGSIIMPTVSNLILWAMGFSIRGGWTALSVVTGGHADWWRTMLINLFDMIQYAGIATILGYVMLRWWKPILIASVAGIVVLILIATQLYMNTYVQKLAESAIWLINKLVEEIWPAFERYMSGTNLALIAGQKIAVGIGLTALAYPIMRGMKVN